MKTIILTAFVLGLFNYAAAQNVDSKMKSVVEKVVAEKGGIRREVVKTRIDSTYLYVLDGQIFDYQSPKFKKIPIDSLNFLKKITDLQSDSKIKTILFFERKH